MAECIEREALIKKLRIMPIPKQAGSANTWLDNCAAGVNAAIREVASFPAADVAQVVHGHWICEWDQESGTTTITCSQCKCNCVMKGCYVSTDGTALWDEENYCPDCGAKMDGGSDHEAG